MAYLDHYLEAKNDRLRQGHKGKPRQILKGARRQHVINRVMDILKDWRFSRFEHEGACLAGLRSALCVEGYCWSLADLEGQAIVGECLRIIGAKRPSWMEGQREYTDHDGNCFWCNGELPLEATEGARNDRFCSPICSRLFLENRALNAQRRSEVIDHAARAVLSRATREHRTCKGCAQDYVPFGKGFDNQKFCSHQCYATAKRLYHQRDCKACGTAFLPLSADQRHCSRACVGAVARFACCVVCEDAFETHSPKAIYCSTRCTMNGGRAKNAGKLGKAFIPAGTPRSVICQNCNNTFEARSARPKYCDSRCAKAAERLRYKQRSGPPESNVIYLTAEIFDGWFWKVA